MAGFGDKKHSKKKSKAQLIRQSTVEAIHRRAVNYHLQGDLKRAEQGYREVINKGYMNYDTYLNLGVICKKTGNFDEATLLYKKAIEINPNDTDAYNNLSNLYFSLGNFKRAAAICKKSIDINANNSEAYLTLGWSYKQLGNPDQALSTTLKSLELKPENPTAYMNLGAIYIDLSEYSKALYYTLKSLEIEKNNPKALLNLSWIYFYEQKLDKSEASVQISLQASNPTRSASQRMLALINCAKGDVDEADNWLAKALKEEPKSTENELIEIAISTKKNEKFLNGSDRSEKSRHNRHSKDFTAISNIPVNSRVIEYLYKIESTDLNKLNEPTFGNARGSNYNFFRDNTDATNEIRKAIEACAENSLNSKVCFSDSFYTILSGSGKVEKHAHITPLDKHKDLNLGANKYALVYYLEVGELECTEPGFLKLYEPDDYIQPANGMVVIIPACRYHSVKYNGTKDRIIIGVNLYTTGPLKA